MVMDKFLQDLRLGTRMLIRTPMRSFISILTFGGASGSPQPYSVDGILAARPLQPFLYYMKGRDPVVSAAVFLCFAAAGLFASFIPARRATKINPVVACPTCYMVWSPPIRQCSLPSPSY